jgi:hypothetical protein
MCDDLHCPPRLPSGKITAVTEVAVYRKYFQRLLTSALCLIDGLFMQKGLSIPH